jgi:hypothetical protein
MARKKWTEGPRCTFVEGVESSGRAVSYPAIGVQAESARIGTAMVHTAGNPGQV